MDSRRIGGGKGDRNRDLSDRDRQTQPRGRFSC